MWFSRKEIGPQRLRVDPVACSGVGICAHLAPRLVTVDDWGFPIMPREALSADQRASAKRAVRGCPQRALFLAADD